MTWMRSIRIAVAVAAVVALAAIPANAFVHIGTPDLQLDDMNSGGKPQTLVISGLTDISDYAFDGSTLEVPFTLSGSGATVWLIVYTVDQHPPLTIEGEGPGAYADAEHMDPGWHVYDDVDWLVYKSEGQRFDEGANVITWDGHDLDGNVVPPGSYDLFLAAFDDEATPQVVGPVSSACCNTGGLVINTQRGEIADFLRLWQDNMENDWVGNITAADPINNQSLIDACGDREGCTTNYNAVTPLNDDLTEFIGNSWSGTGMWISRFHYDWDTRQITVDEEWGIDAGVENGMLMVGDILPPPGRMYQTATNPDKSVVWGTVGVSGIVSKIAAFDVATGEHLPAMDYDLSDIFLYDNNGADRSAAPGTFGSFFDGNPDPYGLTMSGHHTSLILRLDFDGNVKYINRNGDGFGDSKIFAEGVFGDLVYGHTEAPAFKYSASGTKWGWYAGLEAGTDALKNGFMLGEDGSGLFFFEPKNVPVTWPGKNIIVDDNDGDWDGMYMTIGGIQTEAEANDWQPLPDPVAALFPMVQLPYDQKRVSLGESATAVAEISAEVPQDSQLGDAFPNPFNPETTIRFSLPWDAQITVAVYNYQGQVVRTLVDQRMGPGEFQVTWDGRDDNGVELASGVYLYKITGPSLTLTKKVTFIK